MQLALFSFFTVGGQRSRVRKANAKEDFDPDKELIYLSI